MTQISLPDELILTFEDFDRFVEEHFPYHVNVDNRHLSAAYHTTLSAGPSRYGARRYVLHKQVHLETIGDLSNPYYRNTGTWFFIESDFYFSILTDAIECKLRN